MKLVEISRLTVAGCAVMLLIACGQRKPIDRVYLDCLDCAESGIPINIWEHYGVDRGKVIEQLPHGWPVELAYTYDGDDGQQWANIIYCTSSTSCDNGYISMTKISRTPPSAVRPATPTATAVPSPTPTETPVLTPTPIPTATPVVPIVALHANLRAKPETNAEILKRVDSGTVLELIGMTADGEWLQTSSGLWLRSGAMRNVPADLPVVSFITTSLEPMPTPAP